MKNQLSIWLILLSFPVLGQSPPLQWLSSAGSSTVDQGQSVCYDAAGNIYSTGFFGGVVDFDASASVFTLSSNGGSDIFVMKSDVNGNFLWAKSLGGIGNDEAYCIDITSGGDLLITGDFESVMDVDPSPSTYTLPFNGYKDVFILKLNSSGNFIWAKSFGSGGEENAGILTQDQSGNIYIGGYFSYTTDFDPGSGIFTLTANGSLRDTYALKLDATGNFMWAKTFGGSISDDGVCGLSVDQSGNLLISALFMFTIDIDPGASTFTLSSPNVWSTAIIKLDPSGNFLWGKMIGGNNNNFCGQLASDASGNVYTIGNFDGTTDFDPGPGTYYLTSAGGRDIWVNKLDASGNFIWAKIMGGTQFMDIGTGITIDAAGDIYLTGSFDGLADMDPNAGTYTLSSLGGSGDIFAMKLSSTGNLIWAEGFGSSGPDMGRTIKADAAGNVYLTGFYSGVTDFYPGPISYLIVPQGLNDIFVQKLGPCTASPPLPYNTTPGNLQSICAPNTTTLTAIGLGFITWYNVPTGGIIITTTNSFITPTLSTAGVYTYYIEAGSSCGNSTGRTAVTLTVHPQPTVTVISGSVCVGESFTIVPSGAASYTIETGNFVVSPTVTSSYSIMGKSSAGCVSDPNAIATVTVSVLARPQINITANETVICASESLTLSASGANTYSWNTGITTSTLTANSNSSGTYIVTGVGANGCSNSASLSVTVSECTEIVERVINKILVAPNPASDFIKLDISETGFTAYNFSLINSVGQIIRQEKRTDSATIQLNEFAKGLYYLRIDCGTELFYFKLIKN